MISETLVVTGNINLPYHNKPENREN
jgi:hypothetical protein